MRKESETPSGIRLMLLLKGHLREIMDRECANQTSIHLYCTCLLYTSPSPRD